MIRRPPRSPLFPSTPLFRSRRPEGPRPAGPRTGVSSGVIPLGQCACRDQLPATEVAARDAAADTGKDLVVDRPTCDGEDRKSTRLNSSHDQISYAVFCLKKK